MINRYFGVDISLTSPGFAVIDVIETKGVRRPTLVSARHVKTNAKQSDGMRFSVIDAYVTVLAAEYGPFTAIIREDYKRPASKRQGQTIFGAWAAVDSGLNRCGQVVTHEVNASTVKQTVGGHGRAEKNEVADGVRRILRLPSDYAFGSDDESDACAIILTHLITEGVIAC